MIIAAPHLEPDDQLYYRLGQSQHAGAFLELRLVRKDRVAQLDFCPQEKRWVLVPRWRRWEDVDFSDWQPWLGLAAALVLEQERDEALRQADEEHAQDDEHGEAMPC